MSTTKEARRDATEFARAAMATGEGAGNRRRLIEHTVEFKMRTDPAYAAAFRSELSQQDMAAHAAKSRKDSRRVQRNETVRRNVNGLARGDIRSVNTSVLLALGVAYAAHQTGLDKKAVDFVKTKREDFANWRRKRRGEGVVFNIYNPGDKT